jgi:hypothetical protein
MIDTLPLTIICLPLCTKETTTALYNLIEVASLSTTPYLSYKLQLLCKLVQLPTQKSEALAPKLQAIYSEIEEAVSL